MKKRRRLKENPRNIAYAFRTTQSVIDDLDKVAKASSRTKSLQCEHFVKEGIKEFNKNDTRPNPIKITDG